jgi:hypothetical protein
MIPAPWCRAVHAILHWRVKDRGRLHYDLIRVAGVWMGGSVRDETLRQSLEVARFMARPDVDWARVRDHADATGMKGDFAAALALAHVLLDAPLPEGFPILPADLEQARERLAARRSVAAYHAAWAWSGIREAWNSDSARYPLVWGASPLRVAATVAATRLYRTPDLIYRVITLPAFALRAWWREHRDNGGR